MIHRFIIIISLVLMGCEQPGQFEYSKGPSLSDIDGNTYESVIIDGQTWMADNLRVTHYRNGDSISTNIADSEWHSFASGAYTTYGDNESHATTYGYLYNWNAVNDTRGLAPEGWHIPTDGEWKKLEAYMGLNTSELNSTEWRGSELQLGDALKSTWGWYLNGEGNNKSGMSALPGGFRYSYHGYFSLGESCYFWTDTQYNSGYAYYRKLDYSSSAIERDYYLKSTGYSIRCVKD